MSLGIPGTRKHSKEDEQKKGTAQAQDVLRAKCGLSLVVAHKLRKRNCNKSFSQAAETSKLRLESFSTTELEACKQLPQNSLVTALDLPYPRNTLTKAARENQNKCPTTGRRTRDKKQMENFTFQSWFGLHWASG